MKKIFWKFTGIFLGFFMLLSVAFFGSVKKPEKNNQTASSYVYETNPEYMANLIDSGEQLESQYNLADLYPMVNEHQKGSLFCWIYTSMKSLESALMVQQGEYYNFSEIGLAYMYYLDRINKKGSPSGVAYSIGGVFEDFVRCYQDYGLILESDFSNTNYPDINSRTYKDYEFVTNFSSKENVSDVKPYLIWKEEAYSRLPTTKAKTTVLKRFVKKYGSVFAGLEGGSTTGCLYSDSNATNVTRDVYKFYDDDRSSHQYSNDYYALNESHAVTIIGWNDDVEFGQEKGAFLAMNSWGVEDKYRIFYIPYSYTNMLDTPCGFICSNSEESVISIESHSNSRFTDDILTGSKEIKNFFCYDDEIWINYALDVDSVNENIDIKITSGNKSFNDIFSVMTDNSKKTAKVQLNKSAEFYGGYYTVSFYQSGTLLGKRGIYIYSGTEVAYFKSFKSSDTAYEAYSFDNAYLNADNVATLNVPSIRSGGGDSVFFLEFHKTNISSKFFIDGTNKKPDINPFSMQVSDVQIISSNNKALETMYSSEDLVQKLFRVSAISEDANLFRLQIGTLGDNGGLRLAQFNNALIKFKLTINSIVYDCENEYNFNLFISDRNTAVTSNLLNIFYELDGGENNEANITKYPRYTPLVAGSSVYDPNMTTFKLLNPTKLGAVFVGWYLDKDYTELVTTIDESLTGNITLYAKWEILNQDYFDLSLQVVKVFNYEGKEKSLSEDLVYGDSIRVRFEFTEKALQGVGRDNYTIKYFFYGTEIIDDYLVGNTAEFDLNFPNLESGEYVLKISVKVNYATLEIPEDHAIKIKVLPKTVVFGFSDLETIYNGGIQRPTTAMIEDFYEEDLAQKDRDDFFVLDFFERSPKNVGTYNFEVKELRDKNYTFDKDSETSKGSYKINPKPIELEWKEYNHTYDGKNHFPEYRIIGIVSGDRVDFRFDLNECINAGTYTINIIPSTISNANYSVSEVESFVFEIKKAKITVVLYDTTDRLQTKSENRAVPSYSILGNYVSVSDLGLVVVTEARLATKSGTYPITCTINNDNYECTPVPATYTLTGYYNVYYQVSNGKGYVERVKEGGDPLGVTKAQLGVPYFSKISYSDDFVVTGSDIYVQVEVEDYTAVAWTGIIAAVATVVGFIIYLKKRGSSVR